MLLGGVLRLEEAIAVDDVASAVGPTAWDEGRTSDMLTSFAQP